MLMVEKYACLTASYLSVVTSCQKEESVLRLNRDINLELMSPLDALQDLAWTECIFRQSELPAKSKYWCVPRGDELDSVIKPKRQAISSFQRSYKF
ncbi:hypothetical protein PTKIN_Ptkin09bG0283000 [Pterospermum kingtungense]